MPVVAGAVIYAPHPLVWPSAPPTTRPEVGITELLADHPKAAPATAVGAAVAISCTPPFGATFVLWTCEAAATQLPGATVAPQVLPVVMADHAPGLVAALVAWTSTSIAVAPARPVSVYGLVTPVTVVQVPAPPPATICAPARPAPAPGRPSQGSPVRTR